MTQHLGESPLPESFFEAAKSDFMRGKDLLSRLQRAARFFSEQELTTVRRAITHLWEDIRSLRLLEAARETTMNICHLLSRRDVLAQEVTACRLLIQKTIVRLNQEIDYRNPENARARVQRLEQSQSVVRVSIDGQQMYGVVVPAAANQQDVWVTVQFGRKKIKFSPSAVVEVVGMQFEQEIEQSAIALANEKRSVIKRPVVAAQDDDEGDEIDERD